MLDFSIDPPADLFFEIILSGDRPLAADEFGVLLTEVSKDYTASTGRTLIIAGFQQGSLISQLADIAAAVSPYVDKGTDIIEGARSIAKFTTAVREAFHAAEEGFGPSKRGKKRPGERTLIAVLGEAADKGHEVTYRRQTKSGMLEEVRITPVKAVQVRAKMREREAMLEERQLLLEGREQRYLPAPGADRYLESIRALSAPEKQEELDALLDLVAGALSEQGQLSTLRKIAAKLRRLGHKGLADRVLEAMSRNF